MVDQEIKNRILNQLGDENEDDEKETDYPGEAEEFPPETAPGEEVPSGDEGIVTE